MGVKKLKMGIKKLSLLPLCILSLCILSMLIIKNPENAESFYSSPFFNPYSSLTGPLYQPFFSPIQIQPPLFGYGYPPNLPPFGFGPQPLLSLFNLAGLPSYFNNPNPGYPYSSAEYDPSTLFTGIISPYPYASPFPSQPPSYFTPAVAQAPPTYNIYTSPLVSTLAPVPSTLAVISGITNIFGGGGMTGLVGGAVI